MICVGEEGNEDVRLDARFALVEDPAPANPKITLSSVKEHSPTKSDQISDKPEDDSGGNFGRVARSKIMDTYIIEIITERLLAIPLGEWRKFLKRF